MDNVEILNVIPLKRKYVQYGVLGVVKNSKGEAPEFITEKTRHGR